MDSSRCRIKSGMGFIAGSSQLTIIIKLEVHLSKNSSPVTKPYQMYSILNFPTLFGCKSLCNFIYVHISAWASFMNANTGWDQLDLLETDIQFEGGQRMLWMDGWIRNSLFRLSETDSSAVKVQDSSNTWRSLYLNAWHFIRKIQHLFNCG